MRLGVTAILSIIAAASLAGCSSAAGEDVGPPNGTFIATEVTGHALVDGSSILMTFDQAASTATFNGGCNTIFGEADLADATLRMDTSTSLASTMMACSPEFTAQDEWLRQFVASAPTWTLTGEQLELTSGDVTVRGQRSAG